MSIDDEELDRAIEKLKRIRALSSTYMKLHDYLFQYHSILMSQRMFIIGITIGIMGNLFASYLVEFHLQILSGNSFVGIVAGLFVYGFALLYAEHRMKVHMRPIERKIDELNSMYPKISEIINKSID